MSDDKNGWTAWFGKKPIGCLLDEAFFKGNVGWCRSIKGFERVGVGKGKNKEEKDNDMNGKNDGEESF